MRKWGLHGIRARVDRLAEECQVERDDGPVFIGWQNPFDLCPGCRYDIDEHALTAALAKDEADRQALAKRGEQVNASGVRFIWCYWPHTLKACPSCGLNLTDEPLDDSALRGDVSSSVM